LNLFRTVEIWLLMNNRMFDPVTGQNDDLTSIDELFHRSIELRTTEKFIDFIKFTSRLRHYSLFNNALVYMQNPEVTFYATEAHWRQAFNRWVEPDARPMVILAPMTPVLLVYDLYDTEGDEMLPEIMDAPFNVDGDMPEGLLERTVENCAQFKFEVRRRKMSTLHGGTAIKAKWTKSGYRRTKDIKATIEINSELDDPATYGTLCHELGHIFLGHLGNDADEWWPNRRDLPTGPAELEAEAVSYLVLSRLGLKKKSADYLAGFINHSNDLQNISPGSIIKVAAQIERMGKRKIQQKKHKKNVRDEEQPKLFG